jgi:large subunit ribosomal protein L29
VKPADLRDLDPEQLEDKLAEAKEELFNLRFQLATNQMDNTARMRQVRREVARIATILREKEIEEWLATQGADRMES